MPLCCWKSFSDSLNCFSSSPPKVPRMVTCLSPIFEPPTTTPLSPPPAEDPVGFGFCKQADKASADIAQVATATLVRRTPGVIASPSMGAYYWTGPKIGVGRMRHNDPGPASVSYTHLRAH